MMDEDQQYRAAFFRYCRLVVEYGFDGGWQALTYEQQAILRRPHDSDLTYLGWNNDTSDSVSDA